MVRHYAHWIQGGFTEVDSRATISRNDPATGKEVAVFAAGDSEVLAAAVQSAKQTFEEGRWRNMTAQARSALLHRWASLIDRDVERLAQIETQESGKPIRYARGEVAWSAELTRFAASLVQTHEGKVYTSGGPDRLGLVLREPIGVVGMIVPWNFPMVTLFQKLPFALAAGCTTVIKPSEMTSGTALEVAKLAADAGIPRGVINVVTGTGNPVGEALVRHADVALLSFTGSTRVGRFIASTVGERLGRTALELGGKAANVVFADADIDAAVDGVLLGTVLNQGEECAAGTRLLVERSIHDKFVERLRQHAQHVKVGNPLDPATDVGALISKQHLERVLEYVSVGQREGAKLAFGGTRLRDAGLECGFFVGPTVFTDVTPGMRIFREEIFGPVLTVTPFSDDAEAIRLANDTGYGLANGLWSRSVDRVHEVSAQLHSGTVYVNTYLETIPQMPFGGYKDSGFGRELGVNALDEFTQSKSVFIRMGHRPPSYGTA